MSDRPKLNPTRELPGPSARASAERRLLRLRRLVLGSEQPQVRPEDVGRVLPEAISRRGAGDPALAAALRPTVEEVIQDSVEKNPRILTDVIFPIIGPAIRKAIAHAMAHIVTGLNRSIEHTFTIKGLRWRFEAWRSGKSFAEVVLAHTLEYRVEQVFLVHRETSLPLAHAALPAAGVPDADLVSSMLSAIQDFVRDSFDLPEGEVLDEFTAGDLRVLIENGPRAAVAAVVRGQPPTELRTRLLEAVERIHGEVGDALIEFDGDDAPFLAVSPILEDCLLSRELPRRRSYVAPAIITVAAAAIIVLLAAAFLRGRHRDQEWAGYVEALRAEPGIFVASSGERSGRFFVNGFRDPMARDPVDLLGAKEISAADIDACWDPYLAPDAEFTLVRARELLEPPDSVILSLEDGVMRARGRATARWIHDARRLSRLLPGVASFDTGALVNEGLEHLKASCRLIEGISIPFEPGVSLVSDAGKQELLRAGGHLRTLDEAAARAGARVRVLISGTTDADRTDPGRLAGERAQAVRVVLDHGAWEATSFRVGEALPAARAEGADAVRFTLRITEPGAREEGKR